MATKNKSLENDLAENREEEEITNAPLHVTERVEETDTDYVLAPAGKDPGGRYVTVVRAEKWWATQARKNPVMFQWYMTGMQPAKHHIIWMKALLDPRYKRVNIIAPRESGKTTVLVHTMLWHMCTNPLSTNGIISVSADQSQKRLRMMASIIQDSDRFKNVFPEIEIDKQMSFTQTEFTLKRTDMEYPHWRAMVQQKGSLKDPTIRLSGVGGRNIIGSRFSGWLLLDDIIDESFLSEKAQDDMIDYITTTLVPCVQEEGKIAIIGTRWMAGDVLDRFKQNPNIWRTFDTPAIKFDHDGNRYSYWPEYWPLEKLDRKAEEVGDTSFQLMYMNNPQALTAALFTEECLSQDLPSPLPKMVHVYITTDQALSEKQAADFNVYMAIGIDKEDNWYILDMMRFKAEAPDQISNLSEFTNRTIMRYHQLNEVLFEKAGYQASLPQLFQKERPDVPINYHTPIGDKTHRARNVSSIALNGKLFINQRMEHVKTLKREWINFPLLHDDTLDPVSMLFQYLMVGVSGADVSNVMSPFLL